VRSLKLSVGFENLVYSLTQKTKSPCPDLRGGAILKGKGLKTGVADAAVARNDEATD
jgi:hypothetical protein